MRRRQDEKGTWSTAETWLRPEAKTGGNKEPNKEQPEALMFPPHGEQKKTMLPCSNPVQVSGEQGLNAVLLARRVETQTQELEVQETETNT